MANKKLFKSTVGTIDPPDTINDAGGLAYKRDAKSTLAQLACTGCFNGTFYASARDQLSRFKENLSKIEEAEFLGKLAIYARTQGFMKDSPAAILAAMCGISGAGEILEKVFPVVINNGKMLRNFVQMVRSGEFGRKSLGSRPKRLILNWLESRTDKQLLVASIGNNPSLADIVKMVHPKPKTGSREAFYGWLLGKKYNKENLPEIVREYEAFKTGETSKVPNVPYDMLTSLSKDPLVWEEIAKNAKWHWTRMNLNTMERHGVLKRPGMVKMVAKRLGSEKELKEAMVFPYQIFAAYSNIGTSMDQSIVDALHRGMSVAMQNIPAYPGKVVIAVDTSASMCAPITGIRGSSTSMIRCSDVAGLIASAIKSKTRDARVFTFSDVAKEVRIDPNDSVLTNTKKLNSAGGGTNISTVMRHLNGKDEKADLVIYISDNESWLDAGYYGDTQPRTEWTKFKKKNRSAKMVSIDLIPNTSCQIKDNLDVLNVGGFSDRVFDVINSFCEGGSSGDHWVKHIEEIELPG